MSRQESEADIRQTPVAISNIRVKDSGGKALHKDAVVLEKKSKALKFTLFFASSPMSKRYRVTLVIHKRGEAVADGDSGEFRHAHTATTFTEEFDVLGGAQSRLEFEVKENRLILFHDGPGPYDTSIALTPIDDSTGKPIESQTTSMSYGFTIFDPDAIV